MWVLKRTLWVGVISLLSVLPLPAQQHETAGLTDFPVPAWPESGVVGQDLKDHYVFVDIPKNQYILAYPENLGTPSFEKDGPGPIKKSSYELLRNVEPAVTVAITASGSKYKYVYTVADGPNAKQSIDQWNIIVPEAGVHDAVKKPAGWFGLTQGGRTFKVKDPNWVRMGATVVWSFEKPEEVIQPGSSKTGFEIESDLRPGLTIGYFRKAESVEAVVAASGNIPKPVKDQLDPLLTVEYNSKTLMLLGPKYDQATDDKTIAGDFVEGITFLTKAGTLDANSDFVKTTLNDLKGIQSGTAGAKLSGQPKSPAETELAGALKLSLKAN